ncbi:hypothetical protein [Marinomonas posidonica]|uniref:hypothetical protein n=1 Tax=Marinomonas posidonica TaxID=936476 RepID=UPI003736DBE7
MTNKTEKKDGSGLGCKMKAGIWASLLYFITVIFILGMNLYYSPPSPPMRLNEIGDYLAGAFSPLAFLWLIIGYLMQNRELKNQIEEFKKTIKISERSLSFQEKVFKTQSLNRFQEKQPNFWNPSFGKYKNESGEFFCTLRIINVGAKALKISMALENLQSISDVVHEANTGDVIEIKTYIRFYEIKHKNDVFWINYIDDKGSYETAKLNVSWFYQEQESGLFLPYPLITMPETPQEFCPNIDGENYGH